MTKVRRIFITILTIVCALGLFKQCDTASAHIRGHQRKSTNERTEDGAFSSLDHNHYTDGEHNREFDHEAILGSVKEAEEFDKMSTEESKMKLKILLKKMDLNNDEFIERHELKAWILRSFDKLSAEESEERLEDADSNDDGMITWEEILHDTYGSDPQDLAIDEKLVNDDKATFNIADENKNGYLDKEEFRAFTHPEETPRMFPFLLEQALIEKDIDKDGYISFQEFVGIRAKNENREWLIVEKDKFDHEYDKNGDGRLDSAEILAWLVPSNEELAIDEVDHLFAASDDDHDNRLSFYEILEHHDVFVGSEATDYGDYLHNIRLTDEL